MGNIFNLKTKFSDAFGLTYKDNAGAEQKVLMGCYGIRTRVLWERLQKCFRMSVVFYGPSPSRRFRCTCFLSGRTPKRKFCTKRFGQEGIEVLYDDRDVSAGEKFADSDLIGIPLRMEVSKKSLEAGGIEVKKRLEKEAEIPYERRAL